MQVDPLNESERPSAEEWLHLYEHAPCGYLSSSPNGRTLRVNATFLDLLGYDRHELIQLSRFQDLLSPGGKIFYEIQHAPLIKLQGKADELFYNLIAKDGSRIPVLINSRAQKNEQGEIVLIHYTISRYSDRKKYESELLLAKQKAEAATAAKAVFLSTVTHEIRTPMHAILGASDFLLQEHPRPAQTKWLKLLRSSALNLLELINNVLDLSKIEAGKLQLEETPFHLPQLLHDQVAKARLLLRDKAIDLRLQLPNDISDYYQGDVIKIGQVLTNLLSNAIKFTQEGSIELKLEVTPQSAKKHLLQFSITDTGLGMEQADLTKIFAPFTQANASISNQYGGTGLGLSITQKILSAYGTQLQVQSEVGKGSTFSFGLRLKTSKAVHTKEILASQSAALEPLSDLHVLLVDDNHTNLIITGHYFEQWSLSFDQATSGTEAIRLVQEKDFDLVLMDLKMPGMDGYEATRQIRALASNKHQQLPIIALSASASKEISLKMKDAGMDELVLKPFKPAHLHEVIKKYTQKEKTQTSLQDQGFPTSIEKSEAVQPDWEYLLRFFENNPKDMLNYLAAAKIDLTTIKANFRSAAKKCDLQQFRDAIHKTHTLKRMLGLSELTPLIDQATPYFAAADQDAILSACRKIDEYLSTILHKIELSLQKQ